MRKLAVTENATLDGVIEMTTDWFGPEDNEAQDMLAANREQREAADALLVGRQTFQDLRGFWRDLRDDTTGISAYLNGVDKHVVSQTLTDAELDWPGSSVLRGDLVEQVRELKARPGRDIVSTGSMQLVRALLAAGLVDEVRLFVFPVVLGAGQRLFEGLDLGRRPGAGVTGVVGFAPVHPVCGRVPHGGAPHDAYVPVQAPPTGRGGAARRGGARARGRLRGRGRR